MTDSLKTPADPKRRLMLGTGAGALALTAAGRARAAGRPTTPTYAISRTRYTIDADANLPTAGDTYVLPLSSVVATDGGGDTTLNADNTITVNTAGQYRVMLAVCWPSGHDHDVALRSTGLRRRAAGSQALTSIAGGDLTLVPDTDEHLASEDHPGSAAAPVVRFPAPPDGAHSVGTPFPWTPGTIALGGTASVDVTMPVTGIVGPGDHALASLTSLTDAIVNATHAASMIVSARVIAPDTVRVSIYNSSISPSVTIPQGNVQVLAFNATQLRGGSGGARALLSSTTVTLQKNDSVYAVLSSLTPGDYMLKSAEVFLQIERWSQTS